MYTSPATATQLAQVTRALEEFRAHWQSFRAMPSPGAFAGGLEDVQALDYLDYEGLRYPSSDLDGAALVWGNVLVQKLGLTWVADYNGNLLLAHDSPGRRITVWPFARILEVQERSGPQFGKYGWLLNQVIRDLLQNGNLSDGAKSWAEEVFRGWEEKGTPWS